MLNICGSKNWCAGPDMLIPADSYQTFKLDGAVKLRLDAKNEAQFTPISIYTMFKRTVDAKPNHPALAYQLESDGEWFEYSYMDYWVLCHKAARSFIKLGVNISECIGIVGFNAPAWFISCIGAVFAG